VAAPPTGTPTVTPTAVPASPTPASTASPAATPSADPSPWPTIPPLIFGSELTCGGVENTPAFPAAAFNSPPGAENDSDAVAVALRKFLSPFSATSEVPQTGWRRVENSSSLALFVAAGKGDEPWLQVIMSPTPAGVWQTAGYGPCRLEVLFGDGVARAELLLDPNAPLSPQADTVQLLILETYCSSGRSPNGRIEAPLLSYRPDVVYVAITIRNLPGPQDCQGVDPYPYTLQLSEPLGGRQIFDASVVPPKLVIEPE
jgi:hypothetical protein